MSQPEVPDNTAATPNDPAPDYTGPPQSAGYLSGEQQTAGFPVQSGYPGSGYAQPGYPQPGYPQPGYPQPGYPGPGGHGAPYGYQSPYGYAPPRGPERPGGATASAVLMFIQAAVVLISTLYVLIFASVAGTVSDVGRSGSNSLETEWTIIGILQLVSVGLLIFAGVQLLSGNRNARLLSMLGCIAQLVFVVYWMVRISSLPDFDADGSVLFVVPLMYAVLPVVALALAMGKPIADYITAKAALRTPTG